MKEDVLLVHLYGANQIQNLAYSRNPHKYLLTAFRKGFLLLLTP